MTPARPILKWAGGKSRLLPELLQRIPQFTGRYYEPFCGGAALFFGLAPERAVLGDANADLIATYRAIANEVEDVIEYLDDHEAAHCEPYYRGERARWNAWRECWSLAERAATFLYLNRACFNGLWRVNGRGEMNSPWGKRPAVTFDLDNLRAASVALQRAELRAGDYRTCLADVEPGDLVYLDPPYDGTWTGYTIGPFGPEQQRELASAARALVGRGVHVVASNSDTPLVRSLWDWARIDAVTCGRAINSDGKGRGAVNEIIAIGMPGKIAARPQLKFAWAEPTRGAI